MRLHWDDARCTGCLSCMIVCSERHIGMSSLSRARIHVVVDILGSEQAARYCRQCKKAPCAEACPEGAIRFQADLGGWLVEDALCTGCAKCVEACPFDAMFLDPAADRAIKCDLCAGSVWCVQGCPPGALSVRGRREGKGDAQ